MSDEDRWHWHAYINGFRAVKNLPGPSPVDPEGFWQNPSLKIMAERFWRREFGLPLPEGRPHKPSDTVVRENWRQISFQDLTDAERKLAAQHINEEKQRIRAESPALSDRLGQFDVGRAA